jgi:F-type H+-transporting ATPase subunit epsilon
MADTLRFEIVTPVSAVYVAECNAVMLPSRMGEIEVLPTHRPLLALVGHGTVTAREAQGGTRHFVVEPGYVEINDDKVTLLVAECLNVDEVDIDEARAMLSDAETRLQSGEFGSEKELEDERERLERARARIELVQRATGKAS